MPRTNSGASTHLTLVLVTLAMAAAVLLPTGVRHRGGGSGCDERQRHLDDVLMCGERPVMTLRRPRRMVAA